MIRTCSAVALALLTLAAASARVDAQGAEGTWKLSYVNGATEVTQAIVKVSVQDGKATGELIAGRPGPQTTVKSVTQQGTLLRVVLQVANSELNFEATLPKQASKRIPGSVESDGTVLPAFVTATDDVTLDAKSAARQIDCPPMVQLKTLQTRAIVLRSQGLQSKDAEKKKALLEQAAEADKAAKAQAPKVYREIVNKFANSPAVFEATLNLIRASKAGAANPGDIKALATIGATAATEFGPRMEADYATQVATALLTLDGMEKTALEYARVAEKSLSDNSPAGDQIRVLSTLTRALKKAGQANDTKALDGRIEKLEVVLDKEYSTKMPGFKGTAFEGRKSKSDRAVFMELFTGAMCPPCVAADLAFDVLQKTYKPTDLVLIQYHMHIPGPDPMTNPDTIARWEYYREKFAAQVRGVPCSIFNGKPAQKPAQSGGFFADAEKKYQDYCNVINPLLEENAGAKLTAEARRDGDRIDINVKVSDLNEPADKKLRILLAEETVRYLGSNKIRLHHNVVRAFPGGVAGVALKDAASRHQASINVADLRMNLTKYLDEFEATGKTFRNPARPMAMNHLRVIAFVQDDNTREIVHAVQVEVK